MPTVTKHEADGDHPAAHYLVVGDPASPSTWHLRVYGADGTPDHGLMGDAWAALHAGYRGNRYSGPMKGAAMRALTKLYKQEGQATPAVTMAAFTLDPAPDAVHADGAFITRHGKIFEAGDYPDKQFAITPDELRAAIAAFEPVPIDLEHTSTPLDGKLGMLDAVTLADDGSGLIGTVTLPAWLDALLADTGRKVSATWDRASKRLVGLALVNTPRISDAALLSAFAAATHTTGEGSRVVQAVHDLTAKSGAVCTMGNPNGTQSYATSGYFHSAGEAKTIQALHDASTMGGAKCTAQRATALYATLAEVAFAGSRHSRGDIADLQTIHDIAARQGAACTAALGGMADPARRSASARHTNTAAHAAQGKGRSMTFTDAVTEKFQRLYKLGRGGRDLVRDAGGDIPGEDVFTVVDDAARFAAEEAKVAEFARLEADRAKIVEENEGLRREGIRMRLEHMTADAATFADTLIAENRIVPAQKGALVQVLVMDAQADAALGLATFADGKQGTRVDATKALWASMPVLGMTGEKLRTAGFSVVPADGSAPGTEEAAEARRVKILSQTPQGRQFLAKQRKA